MNNIPALEPPQKRGFSIQEAAEYLGCHPYALRRAIWSKQLRACKLGHRYIFDRADLDRFLDAMKAASV